MPYLGNKQRSKKENGLQQGMQTARNPRPPNSRLLPPPTRLGTTSSSLGSSGLAPLYLLPHWPLATLQPSPRVHTSVLQTRSVTQEGEPLPRPPRKEAAEI